MKSIFKLSSLIIGIVVVAGIISTIKILSNRSSLQENGLIGFGVVESLEVGNCGSTYGIKATYAYKVDSKVFKTESACNAPKALQVGDVIVLRYFLDKPHEHLVEFDSSPPNSITGVTDLSQSSETSL